MLHTDWVNSTGIEWPWFHCFWSYWTDFLLLGFPSSPNVAELTQAKSSPFHISYLFSWKCWFHDWLQPEPGWQWCDQFLPTFLSVVKGCLLERPYQVRPLLWMKIISWWKPRIRTLLVYLFLCLKNSDLKQTLFQVMWTVGRSGVLDESMFSSLLCKKMYLK